MRVNRGLSGSVHQQVEVVGEAFVRLELHARLTMTAVASILMRSSARSAWCSMVDLTRMAVPPPRATSLSVRWTRKFGTVSLLLALR
ncbi:hypothetical protein Trydic_g4654 [Trypoxylus dichotomus]